MTIPKNVSELPATYQRTDHLVETLQGFVSARFAHLTAATGLTDWARQVLNAVNSAASWVRGTPSISAIASPRSGHVVVGHDLPRIRPGLERC
jgi:hypothetical protein